MKKRLTTLFLCLCLVFTMFPATALAGEEQTDGTGAELGGGCICTGLCGEESVNKDCPVCGVEGIDLTVCQGEETQPDTPETLTEAPTDVTESSQEGLGTEDVIITDDSEGVETEGNVFVRAKAFVPIIIPLVVNAMLEVGERALTLESKAFSVQCKKTIMIPATHNGYEKRALMISVIIVLCAIGGTIVWLTR